MPGNTLKSAVFLDLDSIDRDGAVAVIGAA